MPRIRYLKPDFFTDEDLAELPFQTRLFFAGMWCLADREGRLEERPKYLKAMIFPYDKVDPEKELETLEKPKKNGLPFVQKYEVDGKGYLQILSWERHQSPHHTEKDSVLPPPPIPPPLTTTSLSKEKEKDKCASPPTELSNGSIPVKQRLNDGVSEIINYLNEKTKKHFRPDMAETKSLIRARMKEGYVFEDFKSVIDNQTEKWLPDDKMRDYLRPRTLFSSKFESYLNSGVAPYRKPNGGTPGDPIPESKNLQKFREAREQVEKEKNGQ